MREASHRSSCHRVIVRPEDISLALSSKAGEPSFYTTAI